MKKPSFELAEKPAIVNQAASWPSMWGVVTHTSLTDTLKQPYAEIALEGEKSKMFQGVIPKGLRHYFKVDDKGNSPLAGKTVEIINEGIKVSAGKKKGHTSYTVGVAK